MQLAGVQFLWQTEQFDRADRLLADLLRDDKLAESPALWRAAAELSQRRDLPAERLARLERALDAEYRHLPEVINLEDVRRDYRSLLDQYQALADAMVTLKVTPPADFTAKVVRTADRWRSLDSDGEPASRSAARILQTLGGRDLAWDYLTTPVGLHPNEAGPWVSLAETLRQKGDVDLADRAYTAAFEAEPTNAQILWDRAQNLRQAGRRAEAQALFRQLADGTWQPRFAWLQSQARTYAKEN
jgi:tetratricopeptide (TPR) repeat protein